ncbi:MAG: CIA30 family protein [Pseudohongiellaceae bacterium]
MESKSYYAKMTALVVFSVAIGLIYGTANSQETEIMDTLILSEFTGDSLNLGWYIQNDNVMGGQSQGRFEIVSDELIFSGNTNTDGGGFSSIRTHPLQLNLSDRSGIRVKVKGDGRSYTWHLQTDARWRGRSVNYWADFNTSAAEVTSVDIPFTSFVPQFRGFKLNGPELNTQQITQLGLYIYDKNDGPFELILLSVEAY